MSKPFEYENLMKNNPHNLPVPETRRALLMSEGCWKPTWHVYHSTEKMEKGGHYGGVGYQFNFQCEVTLVVRPWGFTYLDVAGTDPDDQN